MKRILSMLLVFLLLCGLSGCSCDAENVSGNTYHTERTFSELARSGTVASLEVARAKELLFRIERGELEGQRAQEALDARTEAYKALKTDAAIAYVRYCLNVTDEDNKRIYDELAAETEALGCILVDAALLLSADPALRDRYDTKTLEALKKEDALSDPTVLPLFERERTLVGEYEALSGTLSVERNGKAWTGDEILSDPTLSGEAFAALYEAYLDLFNREAGSIFLDLIAVRREIADRLGYDSYADYRYDCLGRSYSPQAAARLSEQVQAEFVPIFSEMQKPFYRAAGQLYGMAFVEKPTMDRIGAAVGTILPTLSEPWDYMISHDMYDIGVEAERMPGSFTTYFAEYGAPFLFSTWTGGFETIPTIVHEFGHYAAFYLNGDAALSGDALDLAEIDAQGLELLTVLRYDTLYGESAKAAETAELFYALYAMIDGCMEDAFQQFAYAQENPALETLNAEYERLCAVYGLDALGTEGRSWTQIPHTFQSPFYYISYATGMTAALELYLRGKTDPDAAKDAYRRVLMRPKGVVLSETLRKAGLGDPFDPDRLAETAHELKRTLCNGGTGGLNGAESGQ